MKIEEGTYYVRRNGDIRQVEATGRPDYPYKDTISCTAYTAGGRWMKYGESSVDLIREATPEEVAGALERAREVVAAATGNKKGGA